LRILEGLGWLSLDDSLIGRVKYEIWVRHENVQQLAYGFFLAEAETIRRAEDGSGKLKLQLENSSESIELLDHRPKHSRLGTIRGDHSVRRVAGPTSAALTFFTTATFVAAQSGCSCGSSDRALFSPWVIRKRRPLSVAGGGPPLVSDQSGAKDKPRGPIQSAPSASAASMHIPWIREPSADWDRPDRTGRAFAARPAWDNRH
jgi:hypothetical protein